MRRQSGRFDFRILDRRPILIALAGPNGAGKTTFYYSHLRACGLRFVNADIIARELQIDAYAAARQAAALREQLVSEGESFIFETVFSDPAGDKLFITWNNSRGSKAWDSCVLTVLHIPESERQ